MDYFLTYSELCEAEAEYDQWLYETGNDPLSLADIIILEKEEMQCT